VSFARRLDPKPRNFAMLSDEELKELAKSRDWGRLESEARGATVQRISKPAELYLLRALL
jgi:hypothetical protein